MPRSGVYLALDQMSDMTDDEYIQTIIKAREESVRFFSSASKSERELWVAKEFLDNLGVDFLDSELAVPESDPPDVVFRGALFEIKEIMDQGRRRHAEFKDSLETARAATSIDELLEQYTPRDITYTEVYALVLERASKLAASKYPLAVRQDLDLLFYVNLEDVHGFVGSPLPAQQTIRTLGWRSVSFLMGYISCVIVAQPNAPDLLLRVEQQIKKRQVG